MAKKFRIKKFKVKKVGNVLTKLKRQKGGVMKVRQGSKKRRRR